MNDAKAENKGSAPDGANAQNGQMLSRSRRQAMSQGGKANLGQMMRKAGPEVRANVSVNDVSRAGERNRATPDDAGQQALEAVCALVETDPAALGASASGVRQLCQERRRALSSQGKLALGQASERSAAERPRGRVRATAVAPPKVELGNTLRGNLVTGTQVERSSKMTGVAGSCRAITGTEYIGAKQYGELCTTTPAATPAKVAVSATQAGQRVSGAKVGRSSKVTGDEPGACLKLTGSQYYQPDQSGSVCQGSGVPHKVSVMTTVRERPVTGTDVAASAAVTGSEYGACSSVTGTAYAGLQQYQACNREPVLTPEKVSLSRTWREQTISGTAVEHNAKVTGDEYGGCQPISGTEYIGSGQYSAFCPADSVSAAQERVATPRGAAGESTTGVGLDSGNKVTGSARSSALRLSGTPYSDDAQYAVSGATGMNQHPLSRSPADRDKVIVASTATLVQSSFSVMSPARTAQASQLNRVTGTASGAQGRITGPVNLATGLVSGTPEFRYKEDNPVAVKKPASADQVNRVTGEGREAGFAITGAAWQRGGSITGTEGTSATRRNPTLRGDQRSMTMQVPAMKDREHLQVPPSKVTGSSGNTATGSTITYSGGARG